MADNATAVAENETEESEPKFAYPTSIADGGPGTRKVTVEIPRDRIDVKLAEQYKELRSQAQLPGFRPGHAPLKLVQKKFSTDVNEQVQRSLIAESYQQALEENSLQVIGEPEFENPDEIKFPESGPFSYTFTVEVQPEFELPDLTSMTVKKPKIEITDEHVQQARKNLSEQQGTLVPVTDRGVTEKDYLTAAVTIKNGDETLGDMPEAQIVARPGRVAGIQIDDLAAKLDGLKPGETREFTVAAPDDLVNETLKGKQLTFVVALKDLKKLEEAVIDDDFLESLGFEKEQELNDALREQMEERVKSDIQTSLREQISNALIEKVDFELPAKLSTAQEQRVLQRRAMDLIQRGMPADQITSNMEQLKGDAKATAMRDLKLFFILQKVAKEADVEVTERELNTAVAEMAMQSGERPEKLKTKMEQEGTLQSLYLRLQEQKALDSIVDKSIVEEVEPEPATPPA